jgi:hypothetical protein
MSIGVAEPEDAIDERDAVAEMAIDFAAQVVLGMKRLGDEAERHGLAGRLKAKHPIHRRRPLHMTAREVPSPDAAAGQRLGELLGPRLAILAFACEHRSEMPEAACKKRKHQPRAKQESDLKPRCASPIGERLVDRLDESELRLGLRHVADGDDGVGAIHELDLKNTGISAENGQGLLGPENCQQVAGQSAVERRLGLDVAVAIGEEHRATLGSGAFGQARSECSLPARGRAQTPVFQV